MGGTVIETESERLIRLGKEQGMCQTLVQLVCKKLQKGKPAETIADELEIGLDAVEEIIAAQQKVGSYDVVEICKEMDNA